MTPQRPDWLNFSCPSSYRPVKRGAGSKVAGYMEKRRRSCVAARARAFAPKVLFSGGVRQGSFRLQAVHRDRRSEGCRSDHARADGKPVCGIRCDVVRLWMLRGLCAVRPGQGRFLAASAASKRHAVSKNPQAPLLAHGSMAMTERYAHLAEGNAEHELRRHDTAILEQQTRMLSRTASDQEVASPGGEVEIIGHQRDGEEKAGADAQD